MVEPWLRGTLTEFDAVPRQVLHALQLASEDVELWCAGLSDSEMEARPFGIAPVGFHLRHIARSLDRLLTYAEGGQLSAEQMAALKSEAGPVGWTEPWRVSVPSGLVVRNFFWMPSHARWAAA